MVPNGAGKAARSQTVQISKAMEGFFPQSSRKPLDDVSGQRDGLPCPKVPLSVFGEGTIERCAGTQESRQVAMPVAPERARNHLGIGLE